MLRKIQTVHSVRAIFHIMNAGRDTVIYFGMISSSLNACLYHSKPSNKSFVSWNSIRQMIGSHEKVRKTNGGEDGNGLQYEQTRESKTQLKMFSSDSFGFFLFLKNLVKT